MTARDNILQRIRTELAGTPPVEPPPVPEVWPATQPTPLRMIERFSEELQAVQGELIRRRSIEEAKEAVGQLLAGLDENALREEEGREPGELLYRRPYGAMDRPLCAAVASSGAPREEPAAVAKFSAGVIEADYLLADTGSCVVRCETAPDRLLCYLPPVCIVLGRVSRLVEHMPAAWPEIAERTAEPDRRGEFVLITGPSRTADIEKILILGVHGPKRLVVMLID